MSRLHAACFTPLPPAPTGIADYSAALLPYLAELVDLTVFTDEPAAVPAGLHHKVEIRLCADYPASRFQFDLPFYQMGNSRQHAWMMPYVLRYPGVVALHDLTLHHFIADLTQGGAGYSREIGLATGSSDLAWEIRSGLRPSPLFDLPLTDRLLRTSLGVLTNSHYVANHLPPGLNRPVGVLPAMMDQWQGRSRRSQLPWPEESLIFASIGQITPNKRVDFALHAFRELIQEKKNGRFLIVGETMPDVNLPEVLHSLELANWVHLTGHASALQTFIDWIETADVILNLRHPTAGETSASALRAMAAGKPLIVFDQGWYSELPDDACWKVTPMNSAALLVAMRELAANPSRRKAMGEAGRRYVADQCQPAQVAAACAGFLQQWLIKSRHKLFG